MISLFENEIINGAKLPGSRGAGTSLALPAGAGDGTSRQLSGCLSAPLSTRGGPREARDFRAAAGPRSTVPAEWPRPPDPAAPRERPAGATAERAAAAPRGPRGRAPDTGRPHGRPHSHCAVSGVRGPDPAQGGRGPPRLPPSIQPSATLCSGSDFKNSQKSPFLLKLINTNVSCPYTNPTQSYLYQFHEFTKDTHQARAGPARKWH